MPASAPVKGLEVRSSPIQGRGCFTTLPIRKGKYILEYTGRRLRVKEANNLYYSRPSTYLFALSDGHTVIDGIGPGSLINHSCRPNCRACEEDGRVFYYALRNIAAGEELTIDYNLGNSSEREMPCYCGAPNCRGSMFSKKELAVRKKRKIAAARAARSS
jgi:SET domain-containing protein